MPAALPPAPPTLYVPPCLQDRDLVLLSRKGLIKRMPLQQFASLLRSGVIAMGVKVRGLGGCGRK